MRIVVTGGAGFVGSHLIDRLLADNHTVICVDSFYSGKKENIAHHFTNKSFSLLKHDIRRPLKISGQLDRIYNLACPASPVQYQFDPVLTLETSVFGMQHMLDLARRTGARVLQTSTSEVYGDPLENPQKESYWGNVDPLGKRACYDEGKRAAETLCKDYSEQYGVDARIVRIFNTYGPRMMFNDGRVLSNFILQALLSEDITIHGTGQQTRSFMYIDDLVEALLRRMELSSSGWLPVNLGNPDERSIKDLASLVKERTTSSSALIFLDATEIPSRIGDPKQRCPDISRAKQLLGWQPMVDFETGLAKTIADFKNRLNNRPVVAVFDAHYGSKSGLAEQAIDNIIARSPGWAFDVFTAEPVIGKTETERVRYHTVGLGTSLARRLFFLWAPFIARKTDQLREFQLVWAITVGRGALAAALFSWFSRRRVPFLLSAYEKKITDIMLGRGKFLAPFYHFIFRRAHRWQVVGEMSDLQRQWLENERQVQAVRLNGDWDLLAKNTKELFQELEIIATRI